MQKQTHFEIERCQIVHELQLIRVSQFVCGLDFYHDATLDEYVQAMCAELLAVKEDFDRLRSSGFIRGICDIGLDVTVPYCCESDPFHAVGFLNAVGSRGSRCPLHDKIEKHTRSQSSV